MVRTKSLVVVIIVITGVGINSENIKTIDPKRRPHF